MPYYVKNIIEMKDIVNMPLFNTINDKSEKICFDFNNLIPMPKELDIESGTIETVAIDAFLRNTKDYQYAGRIHLTLTDEDYKRRLDNCGRTEEELINLGSQYISNQINYGHRTWYDWCYYNWGTASNGYNAHGFGQDTIGFYTLNTPPIQVFAKLIELNPKLTIDCLWSGEEYGHRTGHISNRDGLMLLEEYEDESNDSKFVSSYCWDDTFRKSSGMIEFSKGTKSKDHYLTKSEFNKRIARLYDTNYFS